MVVTAVFTRSSTDLYIFSGTGLERDSSRRSALPRSSLSPSKIQTVEKKRAC